MPDHDEFPERWFGGGGVKVCKLRDCETVAYSRGLCFQDWLYLRRNKCVRTPGPQVANVNRLPMLRHP